MEKMTKKEKFGRLIEIVEGANVEDATMLVEFLEREIELVSKKRTGETKTQKANKELVEKIYDRLADAEKAMTATEIFEATKDIDGITSAQKVTALVKKLKDAGRVVKTVEGKKSLFAVAE